MSFLGRSTAFVSLVSGLTLAGATGAAAQNIDDVLDRLRTVLAEQSLEIDWDDVTVAGDRVTLIGVTAGVEGETVPIGDYHLSGITETATGYRIGELSMPFLTLGDDEGSFTINDMVLTGVLLPHEDADDPYGGIFFYDAARLANLTITAGGTDFFTLSDLHVTVNGVEDDQPMTFTGAAENFAIDLSFVEDDEAQAIIQMMGYERLEGNFETDGSWDPSDGRMTIGRYDLTIVDAGMLGFSLDIDGYTAEFMRTMRDTQQAMAESGTDDGGLAMLGLLQQLSLHGLDIYFHDDSLTGKVLEIVADMQGMRPQDVVNQAKAVLPFVLAELEAPALAAMVTDAVSAFLDNPQSIRISAAPSSPVPFALLMAGAMASPQALVEQVGLQIVANE